MEVSARTGIEPTVHVGGVPDVLREIVSRLTGHMRYAASETDKISVDEFWVQKEDAQGNILVEPNKWFQLEGELRAELSDLTLRAGQMGLMERLVEVEEAKAALMAREIADSLREAGLGPDVVIKVGSILRRRLQERSEQVKEAA